MDIKEWLGKDNQIGIDIFGKKYKNHKNLLHLAIDNFIPLKTIKAIFKENPALINELDSNAFSCLDYAYMKQAYDKEEVKIINFRKKFWAHLRAKL